MISTIRSSEGTTSANGEHFAGGVGADSNMMHISSGISLAGILPCFTSVGGFEASAAIIIDEYGHGIIWIDNRTNRHTRSDTPWSPASSVLKAQPSGAAIIASIGCFRGFQVSRDTESIGKYTTMSVVNTIFLVIIIDAVFSLIFTEIGF